MTGTVNVLMNKKSTNTAFAELADGELLKKLVMEFKDELDALGVKVEKLDKRVAILEKNLGLSLIHISVHSVSRLLYRIALEFSLSFNDCTYYTRWPEGPEGVLTLGCALLLILSSSASSAAVAAGSVRRGNRAPNGATLLPS